MARRAAIAAASGAKGATGGTVSISYDAIVVIIRELRKIDHCIALPDLR